LHTVFLLSQCEVCVRPNTSEPYGEYEEWNIREIATRAVCHWPNHTVLILQSENLTQSHTESSSLCVTGEAMKQRV